MVKGMASKELQETVRGLRSSLLEIRKHINALIDQPPIDNLIHLRAEIVRHYLTVEAFARMEELPIDHVYKVIRGIRLPNEKCATILEERFGITPADYERVGIGCKALQKREVKNVGPRS